MEIVVGGNGSPELPYSVEAIPIIPDTVNGDANMLECTDTGLFVPPTEVTVQDPFAPDGTNTVDMNISGTGAEGDPYVISSKVLLTPDAEVPNPEGGPQTNLVKYGPTTGIYVSCEDVQDCIGAEIGPAIAGTCLVYDDATNRVNVEIDPSAGNAVGCGTGPAGTGLWAEAADCFAVTAGDCITVVGDSCSAPAIVSLEVSPDPCNGLECRGNGAYVGPFNFAQGMVQDAAIGFTSGGPVGPFNGNIGEIVILGPLCANFTNNNTCRTLHVSVQTAFEVDMLVDALGAGGQFAAEAQFNINGGAFAANGPQQGILGPTGPTGQRLGSFGEFPRIDLPPGGSADICVRLVIRGLALVNARLQSSSLIGGLRGELI